MEGVIIPLIRKLHPVLNPSDVISATLHHIHTVGRLETSSLLEYMFVSGTIYFLVNQQGASLAPPTLEQKVSLSVFLSIYGLQALVRSLVGVSGLYSRSFRTFPYVEGDVLFKVKFFQKGAEPLPWLEP